MKKRVALILVLTILLTGILTLTACSLLGGGSSKKGKIVKVPLTEDMVTIYGDTRYYTGQPITIPAKDFSIIAESSSGSNYVSAETLEFEYSDNIEPGTASIKITAKADNEYVTGSVTVHFTIEASREKAFVTSLDDLKDKLSSKRYASLIVDDELTIPEDEEITIPGGIELYVTRVLGDHDEGGTARLINDGTIIVQNNGRLTTSARTYDRAEILNRGTIEIRSGGKFAINADVKVYNSGTIDAEGDVNNYGVVYSNSEIAISTYSSGRFVQRVEFNAETVSFENDTIRFNSATYLNKPSVVIDGKKYYGGQYENNESIGTATAIFDVD